jgi:predicted glycogen debranching enzyme
MSPAPGGRLLRFVGDSVRFEVRDRDGRKPPSGWSALLRTTIGRADLLRHEIIKAHTHGLPLAGAAWRDLPFRLEGDRWILDLPITEPGFYRAKVYLRDPRGWQHWPDGPDAGISVHPDRYRTANTIYCAFTRQFGPTKSLRASSNAALEKSAASLESQGYAAIPPSGKLRDLTKLLPHIFDTLGCRILHLLPIHPTPTTFARFGRFGSPYAALDLNVIDPALVVFDKRTTGLDQFSELAYETHCRGGRLFLDIVINHTGWGSVLYENRPAWFVKDSAGDFVSPGAWGTTWEDLVELKHNNVDLWDDLATMFLTWCRRGVDGFRCDAAYKVPAAAWQYIIARVQQAYPDTVFLCEGLGGAWEATETLLTEGGMQWAYSELFQNYSGRDIAHYLDHSLRQSEKVGVMVHYSETHDNHRLAASGRIWSLMRNNLSALASSSGGFGFTAGVEWLAAEKINVHGCAGLSWDNSDNIVPELASLNRLLSDHPCFFDGATITRISSPDSPIYALLRESNEGKDTVLALLNTDKDRPQTIALNHPLLRSQKQDVSEWTDLLSDEPPVFTKDAGETISFTLLAGASRCLASTEKPVGLAGDAYRRMRAQAAWGLQSLAQCVPIRAVPTYPAQELSKIVDSSPERFLAAVSRLHQRLGSHKDHHSFLREFGSVEALRRIINDDSYPPVINWSLRDRKRITVIPPHHWLLLYDATPFRASVVWKDDTRQNVESIPAATGHIASFAPSEISGDTTLLLERYTDKDQHVSAPLRFLSAQPARLPARIPHHAPSNTQYAIRNTDTVLLTNSRGGMARLCLDLGRINSKYDCVLGANLHPSLPVDRHIFAKRIRIWVNSEGFIVPLDFTSLDAFAPGPPAVWSFVANAGDGRTVQIEIAANMIQGANATVFRFSRPSAADATGKQLPTDADVRLTVRLDIEDRNFHSQTERNGGAEHHFSSHTRALTETGPNARSGFAFTPAHDRHLRVFTKEGVYHPQPEWSQGIPHPLEQTRGQVGGGDAFSPGWFEIPLPKGAHATLVLNAETEDPSDAAAHGALASERPAPPGVDSFETQLLHSDSAFVVRRGNGKTVIAGYPWFLDWGRDTFICARGLLAAGMIEEVKQIVFTFARFEKDGTLPNTIFGEDASNRDTSDAPLWFGVVCEELAEILSRSGSKAATAFYDTVVDGKRTLRDVLQSIAVHYARGTTNGIRMDPDSKLIWSPPHFTWMDTNYPAGTPREGYPIEIQALWIRLLRNLDRVCGGKAVKTAGADSEEATSSLQKLFWLEERGWYSDVLLAHSGLPAAKATRDDALRSNCLFLVSLGLDEGPRARRCVLAAIRHLVVPGALRTLAPLPVSVPLRIHSSNGQPLNDPFAPYWGRYEGDEDSRRKPAYHNGTAWCWTFPVFCEALARAWNFSPEALAAAKAYLGSVDRLLNTGCLGHLPEIVDGDAPHTQRGCDAQAWSATEALRVWKLLNGGHTEPVSVD